jgi:nucleotide-binding universal stress UspA family protein
MENTSHPRVAVGVDHSVAGYAALRVAVGIARSRRVPLHAVRAISGIGGDDKAYIHEAFNEALGGVPLGVDVHMDVVAESASGALARSASDPRDLIVVGNDARGALRAIWSGSVGRSLFKHARCQILIVAAPEMHRSTRRSAHKLRAARADVWDRFEAEPPQLRGRMGTS